MIPFETPGQFMVKVLSGEYVRYGSILKDSGTGQIVGHLKEVGALGGQLSSLPTNPMLLVSQIGQFGQLSQIQSTLESLQLITSIGALASVATLGVSIAGFISINNKLKQLESKLDSILGELSQIKKIVQRSDFKIDALTYSKLLAAANELYLAEGADNAEEKVIFARSAAEKFRQLKYYYLILLNNDDYNIWGDPELPMNEALELHSRFIATAIGELYASFIIGDIGIYRTCLDINIKLVQDICPFDRVDIYRSRVNNSIFNDDKKIAEEVKNNHTTVQENVARIESMNTEADFIIKHDITPIQYMNELKSLEPGLLLFPR